MTDTMTILFVDDEPDALSALKRYLNRQIYTQFYALNGREALKLMAKNSVDIIVTDMKMPVMDGLTLLRHVKEKYPDTVRVALSAFTLTAQLIPCINTGEIYRFITKPIVPEELKQALNDAIDYRLLQKDRVELINALSEKNSQLESALAYQKQVENQLKQMTVTDPLTGLYNRKYLENSIDNEFTQCQRYEKDLSCLMIDLDHFKQVNDQYGHAVGDYVLTEFSSRLKKTIRSSDIAFRYGGEEFLVLLPHTDLEHAKVTAERILRDCRLNPFRKDDHVLTVTASIGMSSFDGFNPESAEDLLKMADENLYKAKQTGRDRIC